MLIVLIAAPMVRAEWWILGWVSRTEECTNVYIHNALYDFGFHASPICNPFFSWLIPRSCTIYIYTETVKYSGRGRYFTIPNIMRT